jgi:hypothetical protein
MRSSAFAFYLLVSACAVGGASDDSVIEDAGSKKDVTQQKDSSIIPDDSGPPVDSGQTNDVSPPKDSGGGGCTFTGVLATYDFTGQPGNQASTPATSSQTNVTAGAVSRAAALTATAGVDSINSSGWGTTANVDTTRYYTFSITPKGSCTLDVTSLSMTTQASGTGPTKGSVATSDDAFAAKTSFTPGAAAQPSLSVNGATGAIEVRVYGFGASGAGGTMRITTTLTVSGALH